MLTEEALRKMDEYASNETARKFTLRDIVNQLVYEYREIADQLTEKDKQIAAMRKALETIQATLAHKVHDDRTSWSLHKEASDALKVVGDTK